ncbi:MAG: DEAD/DEAH box helicase, partial [Rhodobacteraceae bacterium]|nr:DEAD/DEAH box helicase [Paracoccaceae bacterium]
MQIIQEIIDQLHSSLCEYIEATYHISDKTLIHQRKRLLNQLGVIYQTPYLESTPRYKSGLQFSDMVGLPEAALEAYLCLSQPSGEQPQLIFDPPFQHQLEAIDTCLVQHRNLILMTGTGSGKTEAFLLPILGKLAQEAKQSPDSFANQPAMRALILYPMNALVNDQLGRLRSMFGDPRLV